MIAGQADDMAFETRPSVTVEDCLAMEAGKTGALLGCAAALGAILAGAPDTTVVEALAEFGRLPRHRLSGGRRSARDLGGSGRRPASRSAATSASKEDPAGRHRPGRRRTADRRSFVVAGSESVPSEVERVATGGLAAWTPVAAGSRPSETATRFACGRPGGLDGRRSTGAPSAELAEVARFVDGARRR